MSSGDENLFNSSTQTDLWVEGDLNASASNWQPTFGRHRNLSTNSTKRPESCMTHLSFSPIKSSIPSSNRYAYETSKVRNFHLPLYKQQSTNLPDEKVIDTEIDAYFDCLRLICENQRDLLILDEKTKLLQSRKSTGIQTGSECEYFQVVSEPSFSDFSCASSSLLRSTSLPTTCSTYSLKVNNTRHAKRLLCSINKNNKFQTSSPCRQSQLRTVASNRRMADYSPKSSSLETVDDIVTCSRRVFSLPQISERSESMTESKLLTEKCQTSIMQTSRSADNFFNAGLSIDVRESNVLADTSSYTYQHAEGITFYIEPCFTYVYVYNNQCSILIPLIIY